ncbi:hypothetical protein EYF80_012962 [Liparis tanakae]|uniref:Uncharacterized protein n=1 Tax=Liparis tanakae TaxID=230148 RepID=A0A4Z2IFT5_9TELE|nr:hypothetical protein EYF80_012962 [Liparis tanakae]
MSPLEPAVRLMCRPFWDPYMLILTRTRQPKRLCGIYRTNLSRQVVSVSTRQPAPLGQTAAEEQRKTGSVCLTDVLFSCVLRVEDEEDEEEEEEEEE